MRFFSVNGPLETKKVESLSVRKSFHKKQRQLGLSFAALEKNTGVDMHFRVNSRTMFVSPPFAQELGEEISNVINAASQELGLTILECEPPFPVTHSFISTRIVDFVFHNSDDSVTIVIPTFDSNGNHFLDALVCKIEDPIGHGLMIPAPSFGLPHGEA